MIDQTTLNKSISTTEAVAIGTRVIEMFSLKVIKVKDTEDRYATDWGNKTVEGIGRCMERIVRESTGS